MKIYEVVQKYFDNGKIEANINIIESETIPEKVYEEKKHFDLYKDYFTDYKEAQQYKKDALNA